jgi:tRNA(Arg) A34 adenosine deaminase TadA
VKKMSQSFMERALELAKEAALAGEVPVGAVLVSPQGEILSKERNRIVELKDATAHAEILAIRAASKHLSSERLIDCDLYVTLEPCTMCAGAISFARLRRVYYGCSDPKGGGVEHGACFFDQPTCHHKPELYGGICETEAAELLREFFKGKRD